MKVLEKVYRWQGLGFAGNSKIRIYKKALLAMHLLLFFTPVILMAQPTVGTTTFDGLISGTTNYVTGAGSASVSDVLSTGWNFTVANLNGTSTAAVQGLNDVGDDNGTIDDDVISLSAGGGLNMEYVSFESNDGSEFQLQTFKLYYLSSGNTEIIVAGYKDGSEVVSVSQGTLTSNSWNTIDVSSNTSFDNIDEIRITNGSPNVAIIRIDDISIAAAVASNTAPSFTSSASATVDENTSTATVILDVNANDGDGGGNDANVTYSLSGTDAADFTIDSDDGELRFAVAPDFENPADDGADNVYNIVVTANDGEDSDNTTTQDITITVTDVDEPLIPAGALSFDGVDDYVQVSNNSALEFDEGTIEMWVNPEDYGNVQGAFVAMRDGSTRYSFHLNPVAETIGLWNGSAFNTVSASFTIDEWNHLALVISDSSVEVFINGASQGTIASTINSSATGLPLIFGVPTPGSSSEAYQGELDEVKIWNTKLSSDVINSIKNKQLSGSEDGLVAYYNFNNPSAFVNADNSGQTTLGDSTSNGYNGTLANFALTGSTSNWSAQSDSVSTEIIKFVPLLSTSEVTVYTDTSATLGGEITSQGSTAIAERGVVYSSTDTTPQIGETGVTKEENGTGTGSFSESITGLSASTMYYVQAYAINSADTSYGGVEEFKTRAPAGFTVNESDDSTSVSETGTEDSFTVVLDAEPASNVVITVSSGDTGEGTVDVSSLTFTSANWNTPQTVTVTGVDDSDLDGNVSFNVTLAIDDANSDDYFDALPDQTISVTNSDDETPDITSPGISISGPGITNSAFTATFTFTENVTGFTSADITVDNGSLSNFNATSDSVYTATITPSAEGNVTLDVSAGVAKDLAENDNTEAAQLIVLYELTKPELISVTLADNFQTKDANVQYIITFSEPVKNVNIDDFQVDLVSGFAEGVVTQATMTSDTEVLVSFHVTGSLYNEGDQQLKLAISDDNNITDLAGNVLGVVSNEANDVHTTNLTFEDQTTLLMTLEDDDVPDNSPFRITPASLGILIPQLPQVYPDNEVKIEFELENFNSLFENHYTGNENQIWDVNATIKILVEEDGSFTEAIVITSTLQMVGSNNQSGEHIGFTMSSMNFQDINVESSNIGTINTFLLGFKLNLASAGLVSALNTIWSNLEYPLVPIMINEIGFHEDYPDSIKYIELYDGGIGNLTIRGGDVNQNNPSKTTVYKGGIYLSVVKTNENIQVSENYEFPIVEYPDNKITTDENGFYVLQTADPNVSFFNSITNIEFVENRADFKVELLYGSNLSHDLNDFTIENRREEGYAYSLQRYHGNQRERNDGIEWAYGFPTMGKANTIFLQGDTLQIKENTTQIIEIQANGGDRVDLTKGVTYAITGGADQSLFTINETTGELSFKTPPDFENPGDVGSDNVYEVDVTASRASPLSDSNTRTQVITVTDIEEDETAPTVSITSSEPDPTNADSVSFTITFNEVVSGFEVVDISTFNATVEYLTTADSSVFTGYAFPQSDGEFSLSVVSDVASDSSGNGNQASNTLNLVYDGTRPDVAITSSLSGTTNSANIPITISFDEEVNGFTSDSIRVTNGMVSSFETADSTVFDVTILAGTEGLVSVHVDDSVAFDEAGNANRAADEFSITYNIPVSSTAPVVVTAAISSFNAYTALVGGEVTDNGGASITERGVVYSSVDSSPELGEPEVSSDTIGTGSGDFNKSVSGLTPSTLYYVRAYAINSVDTSYGEVKSFTTKAAPGFTIVESDDSTAVSESGTEDSFTVVLDAEPSSNVIITISSDDPGEVTADQASLTFTVANWDTPQTITLTGVDDDIIDGTQSLNVTLSVDSENSDDDFDGVANQTVSVDNADDDAAGFTIAESGGSTSVSETGTEDSFTVVLDAEPASNVVINITPSDYTEGTADVASVTFTPANWSTPQTVTMTGQDDNLIDGDQVFTVTLSVNDGSSDDDFDAVADQTVSVTTTDDEVAGFTVTESDGTTEVSELGTTDDFTVVLDAQPASDVVILVSSDDTGEATVSVASLTFTNANWNTPQTITVTGQDDSDVDGDQTTTVTLSIDDANTDDGFDAIVDQTVSVTTTDDDAPVAGFTITESDGTTSTSETGTTDSFTVVLDAQPASDVVINVNSDDTGEGTVDQSTLTFTNANWDTPQTVTVTGVDDNLVDGTINYNITLAVDDASSDDAYDGVADQSVDVDNADDDVAGFTIAENEDSTVVSETGTEDSFTVVLDAEPSSNVVIDVTSGDTGEGTASLSSLTFTPANWDTPQTVTITGVDDDIIDSTQTFDITLSVNDDSSDDAFDGVDDQMVSVTNTDDEVAGFTITESDGNTSVSEDGSTDEFTVVLNAEPSSNVVINVTSGDTGEGTIDNPTLTFTPANWNTPQIVTVSGVDDDVLDGTVNYDITLAVDDANSDDAFDAVADQTVSVTNTDDDAIQVSIYDTTVTEGASGTTTLEFTVSLSAPAEAGGVNMDYSTADNTAAAGDDYTAASGTIIFAEGESAKTISVTVNGDQILESNETFTITLSNLSGSNVEFGDTIGIGTITNDDTATVTISNVSGDEDDGEITLTAVLDNAVQGGFTVDLSTSDSTATVADGDYTALSGETLTFTGSAGESKEVTVTLTSDSKVEDDETLSIAMSNLASTSLSIDITDGATVTILNDDTAGFTVTESDGTTTTNEAGTTDDFTVVLSAQPGSNVVIHVTSGDTGEGTIDNPILTFTPANWNTPQTVTVSGVDDSDVDSEQSFDITLAIDDASSDDYFDALPDQTISVTNTDDDAVLISVNDTTVAETNSTLAFTISLSESAPGDITVDYALSDGSATTSDNDYTAASGTVAFNTGESSKTVNVTLTDDSKVEADETFLIYLSNNTGPSLIADTTGTGIITNDDEASVTIADVTVDEEDGTATFIISLDNAVDGGFTVELNTSDSTATIADGDYIALSGEIATFSGTAGETEEVSVTINTDSKVEANELVKLALSSLNTATVDSSVIDITDTALLTITNDDQATLLFTDNSGEEDAGDIQVTVTLNNPVQDGFTVDVSTSDSSAAIADNDYTALLGNTLTFAGTVGETQQFNFTPTGDDKVEADEIAALSFSNLSTSLDVDITDKGFVTISNDDNAPLFTSEDSVDVAENQTTVLTVVASDLDGMSIAYSITGGVDESLFSIDASSGVLTFDDAPDFENPTDSDTNNEYKLTVEASDGTNAVTQDIVISVTDVDDITPVFTSQDIFTINENEISVATITASDGDAISTVTFEISDGVDSSFFDINSQTGVLTFETGRDYESPADSNTDNVYEVQITATDGTNSVTQDISVSISDVNEFSPVFISEADTNLTEGNLEVLTIIATDADTADTIMYLISGGADASLFSIDSSEGLLSFNSAPDFESPDDTGTDNEYNIEVTATDGTNNTVQLLSISVSDLNEFTPVITSDATAIVYEGMNEGTELLTVTSSDGDGTSVVSYSITSNVNPNGNGTDAFAINSTTGLITLADPDDINKQENPELTIHIQANDGQFTANQTITITVLTPPVAESISPENGAEDIPLTGQVSVTFDQDVQTIDLSGISIVDGNDNAVTGLTSSLTDSTISISYQGLANFTIYTVTIPAGAVENEDGVGNLEVQWQFTTIVDVPEQVVLLAPIGGAGSVSVQPTFVWETIERSESAIFQISTDSLFATDVIELDGNTAAEISLSDPLDFYETYYWRVRGVNVGGEGPWSDKGVFVTEAAVPQLTFPINGATGISTAPNIKWSSSHQGTSFEFHFDHTGAFTDLLRDLRPDSTNIQLQGLEANTDYFWRVRVFDDITSSAWSEIRSFTTRPDPEETEDDPIEVTISFGGGPSDTTSAGGGQQTNREVVQTDYRMVGLPGTDQIRLDEFFEGPYKKSWRAFVETGDDLNFYDEYSPEDERFVFVPGLGFWVLSTEIVADQYNFTPVQTNVNDSYGIYMHPGWNIIANPYRSPVEWELVREFNDITGELYGYEEQFQIEDTMEVLKGYYYYNPPALDMDTLFIPYTGFSQRGIEDENDKVSTNEMSRVVVEANLEGKVKHNIEIVYSDTAEKYRKQLHTYHPELGFAKTGLVMSKDELQNKAKLNRTLDSYNPEGQEYNLELKTKVGSSITWKADFNKLPDDAAILLVNKATNEAQLIHYDEVFRVKASEPVSKYTLYVGDRSYLKEIEQSLIPDKVELRQNYPNPFNPQTTINYALAEEVSVHIEVYDILGRLVATLVNNETQKAGWHKVAFDGSRLASGVYFYRLNAGKEVRLGKMTLIK